LPLNIGLGLKLVTLSNTLTRQYIEYSCKSFITIGRTFHVYLWNSK
jgi:hypothetical protein